MTSRKSCYHMSMRCTINDDNTIEIMHNTTSVYIDLEKLYPKVSLKEFLDIIKIWMMLYL